MGKRGPKPTPTAVLKKRGSWLAKTRKAEPEGVPGIPSCPNWMDKEAKAEWMRILPILAEMQILSASDSSVIAGYCQNYSRWMKAERALRKASAHLGSVQRRRIEMSCQMAYRNTIDAAARLGLSPADRAGVRTSEQTDDSNIGKDKEGFFHQAI